VVGNGWFLFGKTALPPKDEATVTSIISTSKFIFIADVIFIQIYYYTQL
jgi:hypothetical protein